MHGGEESLPIVEKASQVLDPFLVSFIASKKGSITGEHGIGLQRAHQISQTKDPQILKVMRQFKQVLDPNSIMNPYKVIPL